MWYRLLLLSMVDTVKKIAVVAGDVAMTKDVVMSKVAAVIEVMVDVADAVSKNSVNANAIGRA